MMWWQQIFKYADEAVFLSKYDIRCTSPTRDFKKKKKKKKVNDMTGCAPSHGYARSVNGQRRGGGGGKERGGGGGGGSKSINGQGRERGKEGEVEGEGGQD